MLGDSQTQKGGAVQQWIRAQKERVEKTHSQLFSLKLKKLQFRLISTISIRKTPTWLWNGTLYLFLGHHDEIPPTHYRVTLLK